MCQAFHVQAMQSLTCNSSNDPLMSNGPYTSEDECLHEPFTFNHSQTVPAVSPATFSNTVLFLHKQDLFGTINQNHSYHAPQPYSHIVILNLRHTHTSGNTHQIIFTQSFISLSIRFYKLINVNVTSMSKPVVKHFKLTLFCEVHVPLFFSSSI